MSSCGHPECEEKHRERDKLVKDIFKLETCEFNTHEDPCPRPVGAVILLDEKSWTLCFDHATTILNIRFLKELQNKFKNSDQIISPEFGHVKGS